MAKEPKSLLPAAKDLVLLSPQKIQLILDAINLEGERDLRYASLSLICGTIGLLVALGCFSYLVGQGHDKAAGVILGATVLGAFVKVIGNRL